MRRTQRGFLIEEFTDRNGVACSIQQSSIADRPSIWLGVDDAEPKIMASQTPAGGNGWVPFAIPDEVSLTTRMHLTQEHAAMLIPLLRHFADTGRLPDIEVAA